MHMKQIGGLCFTVHHVLCREVHHGGLGKERDAVSRLRGETGSTEEAPGQCSTTEATKLQNKEKLVRLLKMNEKLV